MRGRWMLAGSLALALVAPPSMAGAAPPRPKPTPNVAPQPDPELLARARTLSVEGSKRFDTRDYGGAIVAWSEAYALLPDEPIYQSYRLHFLIQIAFSHKENYRYTGDVFYLEFAKTEFERYHASLPADDLGGRSLIDEELVWIVDQMKKFEGAEAARAQDAYEIYLQTYLRSHAAGP